MASKRSLYKPVKTHGNSESRKPLAQGRLVSGSTTTIPKPPVLASGIDDSLSSIRSDSRHRSGLAQEPRGFLHSTANEGEPAVTPRKTAPMKTEHYSPSRTRPVDDLDLTDSDLDLSQQLDGSTIRTARQHGAEVLLVDASSRRKDPNLSEVDVKVGFERTPVKVVCHSPASLNSSLRNSVKGKGTQRVHIDEVPNVSVINQNNSRERTPPHISAGRPEPFRDDQLSPLDTFPVVSQMMKESGHIPQPNFNDSPRSDISDRPVRDVPSVPVDKDDVQSVSSDTCSVNELFTKKPTKKATSSGNMQPSTKAPGTGRKKKIVPSRFMSHAESKAKASRSLLEKSTKAEGKHKANKSDHHFGRVTKQPAKKPPNLRVKAPIGVDSRPLRAEKQNVPGTPDNAQMSPDRKTSTPTNDGSNFPQEIDASAIHSEMSILSTGDISHRNTSHPRSTKRKDKSSSEITQDLLLRHYNRYLQVYFLECKARKTFQERQRQAMAQIQWVYDEVERLRAVKHEKEKELARLKHMNKLDVQLALQKQSLNPVSDKLATFTTEYDTLARALDVTRHQIPVDDIYLPDDDEQYQNQLVSLLGESEHLLGQLASMTRQSSSNVNSTANALLAVDKAHDKECEELKRCRDEINVAESLVVKELALKGQELQDTC